MIFSPPKMSVSPKNLISRFHDLKIWQKHHDGIFRRSRKNSRESDLSHLELMDGVTVLGSSPEGTPERSPPPNREEIVLPSPPKTFEEILQEKLEEEDPPLEIVPKPKKPYLKKGSGLKRYCLEPGNGLKFVSKSTGLDRKGGGDKKAIVRPKILAKSASPSVRQCKLNSISNIKKTRPKSLPFSSTDTKAPQQPKATKECTFKTASDASKDKTKQRITSMIGDESSRTIPPMIPDTRPHTKRNLTELKKSLDWTPLKMPSFNVQLNAKWCKADEVEPKKNVRFADAGDFYFNRACEDNIPGLIQETTEHTDNIAQDYSETIEKGKETFETFKKAIEKLPSQFEPDLNLVGEPNVQHSEQSLYEKQLEKELLVFEMLEQTAENSSFCSTNSSIMQLLTSSPSKLHLGCRPSRLTMDVSPLKSIKENDSRENTCCLPEDNTLSADSLLMQIKALLTKKLSREFMNGVQVSSEDTHQGVEIRDIDNDAIDLPYQPQQPPVENSVKRFPIIETQTTDPVQKRAEKFSDEEEWSTNTEISDTSLNTSSDLETSHSESEDKEMKDVATNTSVQEQAKEELKSVAVSCNCSEETHKKLTELNKEIAAFRADNAELQKQRRQLQDEKTLFEEKIKKLRKELDDERVEVLYQLEEDKKKLAKEKMVFERYAKESRHQPNRKEREEISNLKVEVANLKETIKLKDTKNGTTQARLRTQIKQLEKENSNLKEELEKSTRENAKLVAQQKINSRPSDTKIIHEINKNLSKIAKEAFKNRAVCNNSQNDVDSDSDTAENDKDNSKILWQANSKRRNAKKTEKDKKEVPQRLIKEGKICVGTLDRNMTNKRRSDGSNDTVREDSASFEDNSFKSLTHIDIERNYVKVFGQANGVAEEKQDTSLGSDVKKIDCTEVILEDGTKEIRYDNGDVKTISPDGNYVTKKYINGDVREMILSEGVTKYVFRHDGSCHTTYADGTEIFEFPTGQIEKKYRDGKYEIQFPNGVVRAVLPNGTEEITYPDGTFVVVDQSGTKTLYLKNGQKEIHTEHEKRREYPDGTVKILYNDGRQETRYATGRIRIKDKDGTLVSDTHSIQ